MDDEHGTFFGTYDTNLSTIPQGEQIGVYVYEDGEGATYMLSPDEAEELARYLKAQARIARRAISERLGS